MRHNDIKNGAVILILIAPVLILLYFVFSFLFGEVPSNNDVEGFENCEHVYEVTYKCCGCYGSARTDTTPELFKVANDHVLTIYKKGEIKFQFISESPVRIVKIDTIR